MPESKKRPVKVTVKEPAAAKPATGSDPAAPTGAAESPRTNPYAVIADSSFTPQGEGREDLTQRILDDPRMHDHKDGFLSCIQCGICTSGCPAARFTEFVPREVARRALDGDETLLTDDSVWYCYYCYTCQSRCPRGNSVAVINQVVRSAQVEAGHGRQHVAMFSAWGEQFYEKGMGGTPHVFFQDIADAWGPKWKDFIANRDAMRDELGLGSMYPSENTVSELQTIFEETGFVQRIRTLGAWEGKDPKGRDDEDLREG
jgi:heterodisulfide reductase subunit C